MAEKKTKVNDSSKIKEGKIAKDRANQQSPVVPPPKKNPKDQGGEPIVPTTPITNTKVQQPEIITVLVEGIHHVYDNGTGACNALVIVSGGNEAFLYNMVSVTVGQTLRIPKSLLRHSVNADDLSKAFEQGRMIGRREGDCINEQPS